MQAPRTNRTLSIPRGNGLSRREVRKKYKSTHGTAKRVKLSSSMGTACPRYLDNKPVTDKLNVDSSMKDVALIKSDIVITS
ncbi:hypothetical protein VSU01S_14810 [Vibrio superstes NBRC 103154]|uniref:Uncharacterized protein n=1 Tax=Vibrio superstes NBRC 103154 TaxID=1219062 RepID=A0A511QQR6_9VIBR|nr:hypothetical protein VSU01S_14810 [Vibrio superstes NBRC 103154]